MVLFNHIGKKLILVEKIFEMCIVSSQYESYTVFPVYVDVVQRSFDNC